MENLETILSVLDYSLDTPKKRHIAGGIMVSLSLLFGGIAVTILTIDMAIEREVTHE